MEFVSGVIVSFLTILFVKRFILNEKLATESRVSRITYRQSHIFSLVSPYIQYVPTIEFLPDTQSFVHDRSKKLRIIFTDNKAYWIKENAFYQADLVDGEVDDSTTKVVDTMSMDKVELDKMIFIVQTLTEGTTYDGGSSGFKGL